MLQDVAVGGGYLYWANAGNGSIGRANLNGTGADDSFIAGAGTPEGVAVDAGHIYWTNRPNQETPGGSVGSVGRANLDGTGAALSFIPNVYGGDGIAVDSSHVYFVTNGPSGGAIGRANLDGTMVDQRFISGLPGPQALAIDASHVYWTNVMSSTIGRANLDGTGVDNSFITGVPQGTGVAVDASHIYWSDGQNVTIGRANLDGSSPDDSFIRLQTVPLGLTVDSVAGGSPPVLSHFRLSPLAFRAGSSGGSIARRRPRPVGTTITYLDSTSATTRFTVIRTAVGTLQNGRCVPITQAGHGGRTCPLTITFGSFNHSDAAGRDRFRFTGRVDGHKLRPGGYQLLVQPTDAQGDVGAANAYPFLILR